MHSGKPTVSLLERSCILCRVLHKIAAHQVGGEPTRKNYQIQVVHDPEAPL